MGSMSVETQSLIAVKAYRRRGDIYRWLRENYERVFHDVEVLERAWDSIAADIAKEGVVGVRGKVPYGKSVRKVWQRVCRDVANVEQQAADRAREKQAQKAKRGAYPSRMSRDLRPIPSLPAVRSEQRSLVLSSSASAGETTIIDWEARFKARSAEERQAKLARQNLWQARGTWRFGENEEEHHELRIEFDLEYREKWYKKHRSYDWNPE